MNPIYWVLGAPLAGAAVVRLAGAKLGKRASAWIACLALAAALAVASALVAGLAASAPDARHVVVPGFTFLELGLFRAGFDLLVDPLSVLMACLVTGVGLLIHVFSVAYMAEESEAEYARYFAYLNFFVFSMLVLVLAANFLVLFAGWELVGLSSYLLIGFYRSKTSAADAGKKAFIVNRVGDFGFLMAVFLLMSSYGSLDFDVILPHAASLGAGSALAATVALLLFLGAAGKSAQGPLFVWLPDAMEGPTPVSALIHAATMVTAGVFLVARCHALFELSSLAMKAVAWTGALTALFAAGVAARQNDIKKVLAFSTISQLGYMVLAVGVGAYTAGVFHLFTHAFFKALLFLGCGSIMHALHGELDMNRMGGLRKKLPVTHWTFLVGAACLAGVPLTGGFFSKDEILGRVLAGPHGDPLLWAVGYATAAVTAYYSGRLVFRVFYGSTRLDRDAFDGAHEGGWAFQGPLLVLALGALAAGSLGLPEFLGTARPLEAWLAPVFTDSTWGGPGPSEPLSLGLMGLYTLTVAAFVWLAWSLFGKKDASVSNARTGFFARNGYVDELYDLLFVRGLLALCGWLYRVVDRELIDGAVEAVGWTAQGAGAFLRQNVHNGKVRAYAAYVVAGSCLLAVLVLILGGLTCFR